MRDCHNDCKCDKTIPKGHFCKLFAKKFKACLAEIKQAKIKNLEVEENAEICGDLKVKGNVEIDCNLDVKGCIINKQLEIDRDCQVPSTEEVYNEWEILKGGSPFPANITNVLNVNEDFVIDPFAIVPGTEPAGGSLVFGYNDDQTLDLVGGVAKSYNPGFTELPLKYHGVDASKLVYATADNVKSWNDQAVSYLHQRGFSMQNSDVTPDYQGMYVSITGFIWTLGSAPYIAMKFSGTEYLDLIATVSTGFSSLGLYEPNQANYKNGYAYPIRIPITTDCKVFNTAFGVNPIVYYDEVKQKITVHVPSTPSGHFLSSIVTDTSVLEPGVYPFNPSFQDYLDSFDGTFSLMRRRSSDNKIVRADIDTCQYIVQASSEVSLLSKSNIFGPELPFGVTVKYQEEVGSEFSGVVCPLMNGGNNALDVYVYNAVFDNAGVFPQDPFEFPGEAGFSPGDNPASKYIETYGTPALTAILDNADIFLQDFGFTKELLAGDVTVTYPENIGTAPLPLELDPSNVNFKTILHEWNHISQDNSGVIAYIPAEGTATGMEQDPKASQISDTHSTWSTYRARRWAQVLTGVARGDWKLMQHGNDGSSAPSYGMGLFWRYLATQFDTNYQCMRRMGDIVSSGPNSVGDKIKALDFVPFAPFLGGLFPNHAGTNQAFDQALGELYSKNIKDVYTDFAVSLAFLRNNTSIPEKWQHRYPYWLNSTDYAGYAIISGYGDSSPDFWQRLDTNDVIPPSWSVPPSYIGETVLPTLSTPVQKDVQDLTSMIFNIDKATTTDVTVDIASGEWRMYMVQFTSDGTSVGAFIEHPDNEVSIIGAGTHTFTNIPGVFTGAGSIRLVCANVTMTNYPGNGGLDNYTKFPINSGSISVSKI